jgi:hypothetical protein
MSATGRSEWCQFVVDAWQRGGHYVFSILSSSIATRLDMPSAEPDVGLNRPKKRSNFAVGRWAFSPALSARGSTPQKRMGIRHAERRAEKRMTFPDPLMLHLSVV